jgi:phosphoribosylamine--glycine ligase
VHGDVVVPLTSAGDFKRAGEGDTGPNTGGMGAYSPSPHLTPELEGEVLRTIVHPVVRELAWLGTPFTGVLYVGLMMVEGRPVLIEFNVRFGDPEAEVVIPRLDTRAGPSLLTMLQATTDARELQTTKPVWKSDRAVCVVAAAEGYPGTPRKGDVIHGLEGAAALATVYRAGTARREEDGALVTNGGRVLVVSALGGTYDTARHRCYAALRRVHWRGAWCRKDIAAGLED